MSLEDTVKTFAPARALPEPPKPVSERLAQTYQQPPYVSAVCADRGNVADPQDEGVTIYCVVEGAPIILYFPHHVATALIAQVAQKL